MIRENRIILKTINVLADAVMLICAMMLAYFFRFVLFSGDVSMSALFYFNSALYVSPFFLIICAALGLYEPRRSAAFIRTAERLFFACLITATALGAVFFVVRSVNVSRWTLAFFFLFSFILSAGKHRAVTLYLRHARSGGRGLKNVVLIGSGPDCLKYINAVDSNRWTGYRVAGSVGTCPVSESVPYLGGFDALDGILSSAAADEAVAALSLEEIPQIKSVINICEKNGVKLSLIPFYSDYMLSRPSIDEIGGVPLLNIRRIPLDNIIYSCIKRLGDILISLLLLILTLPFTVTAALGTLITLGTPVIFRQERVGLNRRSFVMYKFRSMRPASEESSRWSGYESSRQTRFGSFLRKFAIDELPQLFNVLKGDMSLVGPRPELQKYVDIFRESVPLYMVKHQVRPGITGWAQVNGFRGDTSIEERIRCDIYYIENWSPLLDIKILMLTLFKFINHGEKYVK